MRSRCSRLSRGDGGGGLDLTRRSSCRWSPRRPWMAAVPMMRTSSSSRSSRARSGPGSRAAARAASSSSSALRAAARTRALFVGAVESDPFVVITGAAAAAKSCLKSQDLRSDRKVPGGRLGRVPQPHRQRSARPSSLSSTMAGSPSAPNHRNPNDTGADANDKQALLAWLTGIKETGKFQDGNPPAPGRRHLKTAVRALASAAAAPACWGYRPC
ncbi:hypothetical protein E2562_020578 [Oryza meyeriana var. granulata]|uniref:Uncharacterized protein n=1 Tax=Oryza meyeriana var. granulata TaxID=110450 RepID=A0A6G1DZ01_9ORYZ|nr:hypothetical protein E2562_020578 [Oryza meyeriana var. granulata]